jgi:hypothetical protein
VSVWTNPADAPTVNQATTVWLKVSSTSWAAEGSVYLWDTTAETFLPATPALWSRLLTTVAKTLNQVDAPGSTVLGAADAGQLFTNSTANFIQYTLPRAALAQGAEFEFAMTQPGSLNVLVAGSGFGGADTIRWGTNATAVGASTGFIGSYLKIRSINGQWFVTSGEGTWVLS